MKEPTKEDYILLRNAYQRRLLNLSIEIRSQRKSGLDIKPLNENRKVINRHYNLLDVSARKPDSPESKEVYFALHKEYYSS